MNFLGKAPEDDPKTSYGTTSKESSFVPNYMAHPITNHKVDVDNATLRKPSITSSFSESNENLPSHSSTQIQPVNGALSSRSSITSVNSPIKRCIDGMY